MKTLTFQKNKTEHIFYQTLRKRVHKELDGLDFRTGKRSFWIKGLFWASVSYGAYILLLMTESLLALIILYFIYQLAGLLIGFSLGHDASHQTAFKGKTSNAILHFFSFLTVGIDPMLWGLRHLRSHHLYANVEGSDIDIDKNPFLRLAPSHPWSTKHRYQHIYAPFVYMLALLHSVFIGDWVYLFSSEYAWMRKGVKKNHLYVRFFGFKLVYFSLILLLPSLITDYSFWVIFIIYVSSSAFTSLLFVIMLVGTHFFAEADYYDLKEERLYSTWAVHQLRTSCDWNPSSRIARYISGGSNCHAAHHLFPSICHTHYEKINPIIEQTTREFNFPYHKKSIFQMVRSHFLHLKNMGSKKKTLDSQ